MKKSVKELVAMGDDAVLYDFKLTSPLLIEDKSDTNIVRFLKYKSTGDRFDCDNCDLANEIYKTLWQSETKDSKHYSLGCFADKTVGISTLGRDTMNSFYTTYTQALRIVDRKYYFEDFKDFCCEIYGIKGEVYKTWAKNNKSKIREARLKWLLKKEVYIHYESINNNELLQEFARRTHTIGNLTLTPHDIIFSNGATRAFQERGLNKGILDYWDLSLHTLKQYNTNKDFGIDFNAYIDKFFLLDYVCYSRDEYHILPLFKGHEERLKSGVGGRVLPKNESDLNEFLGNVNCKIISRGHKMITELKRIYEG
jgi:hypothetical protein